MSDCIDYLNKVLHHDWKLIIEVHPPSADYFHASVIPFPTYYIHFFFISGREVILRPIKPRISSNGFLYIDGVESSPRFDMSTAVFDESKKLCRDVNSHFSSMLDEVRSTPVVEPPPYSEESIDKTMYARVNRHLKFLDDKQIGYLQSVLKMLSENPSFLDSFISFVKDQRSPLFLSLLSSRMENYKDQRMIEKIHSY